MLGCANWRGLRLVPRTELFHFIRHSKGLLFRVAVSSRFTVSVSLVVRMVSRSIGGTFPVRAGAGSYFGVKLRMKCLPEESWMP
jgi:hypothetical protein